MGGPETFLPPLPSQLNYAGPLPLPIELCWIPFPQIKLGMTPPNWIIIFTPPNWIIF